MERNTLPAFLTLVGMTALSGLAACLPEAGDATDPSVDDGAEDTATDDDDDLIDDGADEDTAADDTGNEGGADRDTAEDGDTGEEPAAAPTRFVVLGDGGTGDEHQFAVARAVEQVCAQNPCDFALYLGDNFYSDGVSSPDDSQWQSKFEQPYANLDFPFYAVLGNHDYGDGGGGFDEVRAQAEVDYTARSDKWRMPSHYYSHTQGDVGFVALDTTALDWGRGAEQVAWLPNAISQLDTTWKIAYGHHHYRSNGARPSANENFGPVIEGELCGEVDVYMSGHEHSLQWMEPTCGTEFVISGAAGKSSAVGHGNWPSLFEQETGGFLWVEIDGDTLTGVFYDQDATELFRRSITKAQQ